MSSKIDGRLVFRRTTSAAIAAAAFVLILLTSRKCTSAADVYGDPLPPGAISRLGTVRYRHSGWYKRVFFLPDNETIVVGTRDNTVRAWNARSGKMVHEIAIDADYLQAFCVSPDGKLVATLNRRSDPVLGETYLQFRIYETSSWRELHSFGWNEPQNDAPEHLALSHDGKILALGGMNGMLRLHDVESGQEIWRKEMIRGGMDSLDFSPDGKLIAVAGGQAVYVWPILSDEEPQQLSGLPRGGQVVRFSPDGALLAVGSDDHTAARIYDVTTKKLLRQLKGKSEGYYREGLCFSADGSRLLVPADRAFSCELYDVNTGELLRSFDAGGIEPRDAAISKDSQLVACIASETAIVVWDAQTRERFSDRFVGHLESPYELKFALDDQSVVTGSLDGSIRIWESATGKPLRTLRHDRWVAGLALSPLGNRLASCGLDDTVRLWDLADGKELFRLPGHGRSGGNQMIEVMFSRDGKKFFSFGSDMYLRAFNVENGRITWDTQVQPAGAQPQHDEDGFRRVNVEPFGGFGRGGGFVLEQALFKPDASILTLGGRMGGAIHFMDVANGKELDVFRPDERLQDYLISPDGKLLVTMEQPARNAAVRNVHEIPPTTMRIRDFASKQVVGEVALQGRYGSRAAYSPDGKLLGIVLVENVRSRNAKRWISVLRTGDLQEVAQVDCGSLSTRHMAFSNDGTKLATSHEDSTVLLWDLSKFRTDVEAQKDVVE
jgi:WD40 repeat protein